MKLRIRPCEGVFEGVFALVFAGRQAGFVRVEFERVRGLRGGLRLPRNSLGTGGLFGTGSFLGALDGISRGGPGFQPVFEALQPERRHHQERGDAHSEQPGHGGKLTGAESQRDHELPPVCGQSWLGR